MNAERDSSHSNKKLVNGASNLNNYWDYVINDYGIPIAQYIITTVYAIFSSRLTFFNLVVFLIQFVPQGFHLHFVRNIYKSLRDWLKQKLGELEDIQLQIQIINTKLSVQNAEFTETVGVVKKNVDRLRKVRARIRNLVRSDEELRHTINNINEWEYDDEININCTPDEETISGCEYLVELLKGQKCDQVAELETKKCAESSGDPQAREDSVYSSISEDDCKQDCQVKIVKVTNVYKIAYLKHYIKQKRIRRANRHAMLKKKMENIKKLMAGWQKTLSMVINSKLTLLNMNPYMEVTPQEAMGDYTQANYRYFSDSDSDFRTNIDNDPDEYSLSWAQSTYVQPRTVCVCNFDDYDTAVSRESYNDEIIKEKYEPLRDPAYKVSGPGYLVALPEETLSQMAIEEIRSEASEDGDCRDLVAM